MSTEFKFNDRHGGPFDRGCADAFYMRAFQPHFFTGGTYQSKLVEEDEMCPEDVEAYAAGFEWQTASGIFNFK